MTPEHRFALFIAAIGAFPSLILTGAAAFWTWRRDQERVIVQKSPTHWQTLDGSRNPETLCGVGIVVTNLSLFPIRVSGLAFRLDGKSVVIFTRDEHEAEWPSELASRARMVVNATNEEWARLQALGVRERMKDLRFVALVRTETGRVFASNRLSVRLGRRVRRLLKIRAV